MTRIAIIEASHWHVPLYLDGLRGPETEVVAVSDSTGVAGPAIAEMFGAKSYSGTDDLLANEAIDFAFAFGRHSQMAGIGHALIRANIPFSLEKPCGMTTAEVAALASAARTAGLYVGVPFIHRYGELCPVIRDIEGGLPSDFAHLSFRFIAGAPERYETWNCAWMLDPKHSGGGALMNLGGHFIDLFLLLTGARVERVSAVMSNASHGRAVEDYAAMTLQTSGGAIGVIETGYTFPGDGKDQREFGFTLRSKSRYLHTTDGGLAVRDCTARSPRFIPFEFETDRYYQVYAHRALKEWQANREPNAGLREALEVMKILEAAYASARVGGAATTPC